MRRRNAGNKWTVSKKKRARGRSSSQPGTLVRGKIVVDALALARSLGRLGGHMATARSLALHSSRPLTIGGLPPSTIPYSVSLPPDSPEPTRFNAPQRKRERRIERGRDERNEQAKKRTEGIRLGRGEKKRDGEKEGRRLSGGERERKRGDVHKVPSGTVGSLEFPFRKTPLLLLSFR